MPLRLYIDEDSMERGVVAGLRLLGINVQTSTEAGNDSSSDLVQMEAATADGRMLYTANYPDFARLHRQWMSEGRQHAGIVVRIHQQMAIGQQVLGLRRLCNAMGPREAINTLHFLDAWVRHPG